MSDTIGLRVQMRRIDAATAVVELQGEMDIYTTARAREAMHRLLEEGCRHLIVNLHGAQYLDSTALGALLGTQRRARELGGLVRLVSPTQTVQRLLEITRLTYAFPIHPSEDEALHSSREEESVP